MIKKKTTKQNDGYINYLKSGLVSSSGKCGFLFNLQDD